MEGERGAGRRGIAVRWTLWTAGYAVVLAVVAWPVWTQGGMVPMVAPTPEAPHSNADPLFSLWWIDWAWRHPGEVLQGETLCRDLFFPFGVGLRLLASFQNLVVLALGPLGEATSAYTAVWAFAFLFAALATAALAFEVSGSGPGAFVAGLLVAFGPTFYERSLHHAPKMLAFGWLPLFLLFLIRALRRGGPGSFLGVLACALMILASDWENALFAALAAAIVWLEWVSAPGSLRRGRRTAGLVLLLPVLAAFLWWALGSVPAEEPEMLVGSRTERARYSVDLLNVVLPPPHHALLGEWSAPRLARLPGDPVEKTAFFGWLLPALLAWGAWSHRHDRRLWPWMAMAAVFLLLAMGPFLQWQGEPLTRLPGWWLQQLPGFVGNRAPGRFALVASLALGTILSLLIARAPRPGRAAVGAAVLMALELAPFATPFARPRVSPALAGLGGQGPEGSVLDVPYRVGVPRYLFDQTAHRHPLVTGHMIRVTGRFARHPADVPGFELFRDPVGAPLPEDPEALAASLRDLLGVRYVVVHKRFLAEWGEARRRLLSSGLPLGPLGEDEEAVVLELGGAANPAPGSSESLAVGSAAFRSRVLVLGWGAGGAPGDPHLWGRGRWQRLALAPPAGARAAALEMVSYRASATRQPQEVTVEAGGRVEPVVLGPHWREIEIPLPRDSRGPVVVTFRVDEPGVPGRLEPGGSSDRRSLSVGLRRLRWIP